MLTKLSERHFLRLSRIARKLFFMLLPDLLYMRLYERDTDFRVKHNPARASGRPEEEISPLVISYARHVGLKPHHQLLDFGCGTLRVGKYLIKQQLPGKYIGVDISESAIEYAKGVVERDLDLKKKHPVLFRLASEDDLPPLPQIRFVLAHSVLTHLPKTELLRTMRKIRSVMNEDSIFAFTFFQGRDGSYKTYKSIRYTSSTILNMGRQVGLEIEVLPGDWIPTQTVAVARKINVDGEAIT